VSQAEYSFTLPVGFALIGDSTSVAGAPTPLVGGSAPPAAGSALEAGAPASLARELAPNGESGWPGELPIGLLQDQERKRSREALMRTGAPPRRGRIEEGVAQDLPAPSVVPAAPLMRLSSQAPASGALGTQPPHPVEPQPPRLVEPQPPRPVGHQPPRPVEPQPRAADMEELCEELIARLRRELLVERERAGNLLGA
jgi:hypothetical protein